MNDDRSRSRGRKLGNFSTNFTLTVIHRGSAGLLVGVEILRLGVELKRVDDRSLHYFGEAGYARWIGAGVVEEDQVADRGRR